MSTSSNLVLVNILLVPSPLPIMLELGPMTLFLAPGGGKDGAGRWKVEVWTAS
ncbi:hypothetical protein EJ06DRAFT_169398 [Trichodelitschia bisporula]|uniref:Uncharacterized protein n=1 Tax=Trichodelitschia bisporula TaxID=703511 RepID=A0A6G1HN77_9PEZI|nr:hypothetical protein EJ06DRAFT_169398 [Trichodelitschia bisporula]